MNTHTHHPTILVTPSGQPVRSSDVVAARWKTDTSLRIVTEPGEVIADDWATHEAARSFLDELTQAMRGLTDSSVGPDERPHWATFENATIAAEAVLEAGGTRERAARAFARTLFGEGEPASAIDGEAMESAWNVASGPVTIIVGMPCPDHSKTKDPITKFSPYARLAIAAIEQGLDPARLRFRLFESEVDIKAGVVLSLGEAGRVPHGVTVPRKIYSYCQMNDRLFGDWVAHGGRAVRHEHRSYPGEFVAGNAAHHAAMESLAAWFDSCGFSDAALRVRACLTQTSR